VPVYDLRKVSEEEVARGEVSPKSTIRQRVAEENRCDLTIPLGSKVIADALYSLLLDSAVGQTMQTLLGPEAILYELSYDIRPGQSTTGGSPDTPCSSDNDTLYSTLALSHCKMLKLNMGPTTWLPGTQTVDNHGLFGRICRGGPGNQQGQIAGQSHRSWASAHVCVASLIRDCCTVVVPTHLQIQSHLYISFRNHSYQLGNPEAFDPNTFRNLPCPSGKRTDIVLQKKG
jgi:hypothetical protein